MRKPDLGLSTPSEALLMTDFYELTTGKVNFEMNHNPYCYSSIFFRRRPKETQYRISVGLEQIVAFVMALNDHTEDTERMIEWIEKSTLITPPHLDFVDQFLDYLKNWSSKSITIMGVPDGTPVFPNEHAITIGGGSIDHQILETMALSFWTMQSAVATTASAIFAYVNPKTLIEFGARRSKNPLLTSRAAVLGGFNATSFLAAAQRYGLPYSGTMSHKFIQERYREGQSFSDQEYLAFKQYAAVFPDNIVTLPDTFNVKNGIRNTVRLQTHENKNGHKVKATRLDSGDIIGDAFYARETFDDAGFPHIKVFASDGITMDKLYQYENRQTPIDGYGIGTYVTQSSMDGVYKLVQVDGVPVMKFTGDSAKRTDPGIHQIYRGRYFNDYMCEDIVTLWDEDGPEDTHTLNYTPLKVEVMKNGEQTYEFPTVMETRDKVIHDLKHMGKMYLTGVTPWYEVKKSSALLLVKQKLVAKWEKEFK